MKKGSNNEHMNNIIVTTTSVNFSFMACVDGLYPPKIVEGGTGKKFQRIIGSNNNHAARPNAGVHAAVRLDPSNHDMSERCVRLARTGYIHPHPNPLGNLLGASRYLWAVACAAPTTRPLGH